MNKENLLKMADYIEAIPEEKFDMRNYRNGDATLNECNSIGCVIGHCTVLDSNPLPLTITGAIIFDEWSETFTDIDQSAPEWDWCFSSQWQEIDNTPTGAAKRIRWLVENDLPDDWEKQMNGWKSLCYMESAE